MSYAQLATLAIGGWTCAAILLYCAHFNARLAVKLKKLFLESEARSERALQVTRDALVAEMSKDVRR